VQPPKITTVKKLWEYLDLAMQLEHATIPPYLTALYSIRPETNQDALHVLRVVVVEEMLHLTLAANIMTATGGTPDLTQPNFVPDYPARLPDGENDFKVDLQPFSREAVETFLRIERPGDAPCEEPKLVRRTRNVRSRIGASPDDNDLYYYSIGDFYVEIARGLGYLSEQNDKLFIGDPKHQVTSEYYYSGGGRLIPVTDIASAHEAIRLIIQQGEGFGGGIYNREHELAHFYRFQQLKLGRYYQAGDKPDQPQGPPLQVDWNGAYPIKKNANLDDYPKGSELYAAAVEFNRSYADFLELLTRAYNGQPDLLLQAVPRMFEFRNKINRLVRNPIPGMNGINAAPTFELFRLEKEKAA